jgi:hypothetical protein
VTAWLYWIRSLGAGLDERGRLDCETCSSTIGHFDWQHLHTSSTCKCCRPSSLPALLQHLGYLALHRLAAIVPPRVLLTRLAPLLGYPDVQGE